MSYRCLCGHVIKDTLYPCLEVGDLKWQTESENASQDSNEALKEFFTAVENGTKDKWLTEFFNIGNRRIWSTGAEEIPTTTRDGGDFYLTAHTATIVYDIMSRHHGREGHSVFRCPECERMYIQKEYCSDEYECFEKRPDYTR